MENWWKNWEEEGVCFPISFFLLGKSASDDESESESLMPNGNVRTFKKCTKNGDEHFR